MHKLLAPSLGDNGEINIEHVLEKDMGFVAWLGLIYNTYWIRQYYATDPKAFQKDMQQITNDAVKSLQELISTHKEVTKSRFLKPKSTSPTGVIRMETGNKVLNSDAATFLFFFGEKQASYSTSQGDAPS